MFDASRIAALSLIYDVVIPISSRYYIISKGRKSGVIDSEDGTIVIPIEYTEFKVENFGETDYATLTNELNGNSVVFNSSCGRYVALKDTYRIGCKFNGLLVLNQIRTSNGFKRTVVIKDSDMKIILQPTKVKQIGPTMYKDYKAAMTYIDDGLKVDGVVYFIDKNYRIVAHSIGRLD